MRVHFTPIRSDVLKKTEQQILARVCGRGNPYLPLVAVNWIAIWLIFQGAKIELPCDLVKPHISMGPKDSTFHDQDPCASTFIAVLFIVARK